jgi:hypothetical protein
LLKLCTSNQRHIWANLNEKTTLVLNNYKGSMVYLTLNVATAQRIVGSTPTILTFSKSSN